MVEPGHQGVLKNEPFANVFIDALDGQGPISPGAIRQQDRAEAPIIDEVIKVYIATQLCVRHEMDIRFGQSLIDFPLMLILQFHMPFRKTAFNLPIGAQILLEDYRVYSPVRKP
jgi:hypothetical protein